MTPYYEDEMMALYHGDCLAVLPELTPVDAIVTDPPYGLSFMGKGWDHAVPGVEFWRAALGAAKPGAHLLAFGGTRTYHRLMCAIEDAGWELRDCIMWVYGTGFPKSLDVSKAIDKAAGAKRTVIGGGRGRTGQKAQPHGSSYSDDAYQWPGDYDVTAPATDAARKWDGWGTALKPAWEPIVVCRKPLEGTVAQNVLRHGVGGLNIDACRIGTAKDVPASPRRAAQHAAYGDLSHDPGTGAGWNPNVGRWPANLIHDGSDEVALGLSNASRFFYCAKASRAEREAGIEGLSPVTGADAVGREEGAAGTKSPRAGAGRTRAEVRNDHPTVKPLALMRYLCRLVTPPGGVVLDPFAGSGSTLVAARQEGFRAIGIEIDEHACEIAAKRTAQGVG